MDILLLIFTLKPYKLSEIHIGKSFSALILYAYYYSVYKEWVISFDIFLLFITIIIWSKFIISLEVFYLYSKAMKLLFPYIFFI